VKWTYYVRLSLAMVLASEVGAGIATTVGLAFEM
jgi:hypothetical protein